MSVHIFGIRHHGPGSARSLLGALQSLEPNLILIEGPPDANGVLEQANKEAMQPPIALLVYATDAPQQAVFYPFAVFSPEWQALRFGLEQNIPIQFMDLPQAQRMTIAIAEDSSNDEKPDSNENDDSEVVSEQSNIKDDENLASDIFVRDDPLGHLASAAGYTDGERWWDQMVESRRDSEGLFTAIQEAMVTLRKFSPSYQDKIEELREASMREIIRKAEREGFTRIAVVCGAWHVPALIDRSNAKADKALLKGLIKTKVAATWVPWTYGRLAQSSGYGAGIVSPGWYHHLWDTRDNLSIRWLTQVAALFREEDLPASSAHVIEGIRLAESLAALRDKAMAGLDELNEAVQAVFCFGNKAPMCLIESKLMIGERLGQIPPETPMLPLQQDLMRLQKSLRFQPKASESVLELDLRKQMHLGRSHLLHRLRLLGIPWGERQNVHGKKGSFHEHWRVQWQPDFVVRLIEMALWGNTVQIAASKYVQHKAKAAQDLSELTTLLDDTLLADLPDAVATLTQELENKAALTNDVTHLMEALPPLVQVLRYGNVRKTDASQITQVLSGLIPRICIGLPMACSSLDDDAASDMYQRLVQAHSALQILADEAHNALWTQSLQSLVDSPNIHGLVVGRAMRLLFDTSVISSSEAARHLGLALSRASEPAQAAAWIEGFLKDSGIVLLHDESLWKVLDDWLQGLSDDVFTLLVPLLRRTFVTFSAAERRQMGERVKHGGQTASDDLVLDEARAQAVMPIVRQLLGITEIVDIETRRHAQP